MRDFGTVAALGLQTLLTDAGFEVLPATETSFFPSVIALRPDAVVFDSDDHAALEQARHIAAEFPAIPVVACSSERALMHVFPPFHQGESYVLQLTRDLLAEALQ